MRKTRTGSNKLYVGPPDNTKLHVIVSSAQEVKIYSATVEGQKSKEINRQKKMTSDRRGVPTGPRKSYCIY
jgi:hypothetical protein